MDPYEHRRSRPLHKYRHGWRHLQQHRTGVRHGHRRHEQHTTPDPQRTPTDSLRHARRVLRRSQPGELARQALVGTLLALAIAFVVFSVWGLLTVLEARNDLRGAQSEATALAHDRTQLFTSVGRARAAEQIAAMHRGASDAASLVDGSIPLEALGWIPFVGQQVHGVTSLVNDFNTTSVQAGSLLASLRTVVGASHGTSISLPALKALDDKVRQSVAVLTPLNRGSGLLIGPLASARDTFDTEISEVTGLLTTGGHLLDYAQPFLGSQGPRTYFVAGENNAEMRDQGAVLSWAILSANDGTFTMTKSHSVGTISLRHPAPVALPPGTLAAFGQLQPTRIWQSVNATADFPLSAQIMAAMYHQRTHKSVDGVIGVDPITLQHMLEATGRVYVKGIPGAVKSSNVIYVLMHGLYLLYPHAYQIGTRHDEVAAVASAAVRKMKRHPHLVDLAYLVDQLAKAVKGRHLLVWSKFPVLENAVDQVRRERLARRPGHERDPPHDPVGGRGQARLVRPHRGDLRRHRRPHRATALIKATVVVANTAPKDCTPALRLRPEHQLDGGGPVRRPARPLAAGRHRGGAAASPSRDSCSSARR